MRGGGWGVRVSQELLGDSELWKLGRALRSGKTTWQDRVGLEVENLRAEAEQKGFLLKEGTLLFVALRKLPIRIFNQVTPGTGQTRSHSEPQLSTWLHNNA